MRLTKQKVHRGDKVFYFLPKEHIELLRITSTSEKYKWKFPKIEFKSTYVIIPYIELTPMVYLKTFWFILKNMVLGTCFFDDMPGNIRGVLIDFDDLIIISRFEYFMRLIELPIMYKISPLRRYYVKIYTRGYTILKEDPIVIYKKGEIFVLDEKLEIESGYSVLNKNKNIKGNYYYLIEKYKAKSE